ncbi:uncharacterized protein [Ptychodera flava]|uniref:uncharacterized protein n=1 Tax=Ptychodera flava TaxID=63121 RepID=UPI00396A122D
MAVLIIVAIFIKLIRRKLSRGDKVSNNRNSRHGALGREHSTREDRYDDIELQHTNVYGNQNSDQGNDDEESEPEYTSLDEESINELSTGLQTPEVNNYENSETDILYTSLEKTNAGLYMGLRQAPLGRESNLSSDYTEIF